MTSPRRKKPTAANWRKLADAARQSREAHHLARPELAKRANVSEGSVERLETAIAPQTDKFPRAYAWVLSALGWPPDWAEKILNGAESGPPETLNRPNGPSKTPPIEPTRVEELLVHLAHLLRGDAARVIAEEVSTTQIVELMRLLGDALVEREAMSEEWAPAVPTPERRRRPRLAPPAR